MAPTPFCSVTIKTAKSIAASAPVTRTRTERRKRPRGSCSLITPSHCAARAACARSILGDLRWSHRGQRRSGTSRRHLLRGSTDVPPPPTSDDAALSRWIESDEARLGARWIARRTTRCSADSHPQRQAPQGGREGARRRTAGFDHHGARRLRAPDRQAPAGKPPRARAPNSACAREPAELAIHHEVGAARSTPCWGHLSRARLGSRSGYVPNGRYRDGGGWL